MPRFTIRIELLDATSADYAQMYEYLDADGIVDEITDRDGKRYRLPPAEYHYAGTATRSVVLDKVKKAAANVVTEYRVLVTESAGRTWHNLEKL